MAHYREVKPADKEIFAMKLGERVYTDKKEAGAALIAFCKQVKSPNIATPIGEYLGFKISVTFDSFSQKFTLNLKGALSHNVEVGSDVFGNLTRINNALSAMEHELTKEKEQLSNTEKQLENAKEEVTKPFAQEEELNEKMNRLAELNALLNMDEKGTEECLDEPTEETEQSGVADVFYGESAEIKKFPTATVLDKGAVARPSIMEKLAHFKEQTSRMETQENRNIEKAASL